MARLVSEIRSGSASSRRATATAASFAGVRARSCGSSSCAASASVSRAARRHPGRREGELVRNHHDRPDCRYADPHPQRDHARKAKVLMPSSKLKLRIAEILSEEGFIGAVRREDDGEQGVLTIVLSYDNDNRSAIDGHQARLAPRPARLRAPQTLPSVRSGLGIAILTTSEGVMSEREARKAGSAASSSARSGRHVAHRQKPIASRRASTSPSVKDQVEVKGPKGKLKRAAPDGVTVKTSGDRGARRARRRQRDTAPCTASCARSSPTWSRASPRASSEARAQRRRLPRRGKGQTLNLALGFSHPVIFALPKGIIGQGRQEPRDPDGDNEQLGQTAAKIRGFRPPEPYRGKGVRYLEEGSARRPARPARRRGEVAIMANRKEEGRDRRKRRSARRSAARPSARACRCSARRSTSTRRSSTT